VVDVMTMVAVLADVTSFPTAREGVCIAAGVTVVGGCERRNEKGVRGGAACVIGIGAE
jgi:hypothetical protein